VRVNFAPCRAIHAQGRAKNAPRRVNHAHGRVNHAQGRAKNAQGRADDAQGRMANRGKSAALAPLRVRAACRGESAVESKVPRTMLRNYAENPVIFLHSGAFAALSLLPASGSFWYNTL